MPLHGPRSSDILNAPYRRRAARGLAAHRDAAPAGASRRSSDGPRSRPSRRSRTGPTRRVRRVAGPHRNRRSSAGPGPRSTGRRGRTHRPAGVRRCRSGPPSRSTFHGLGRRRATPATAAARWVPASFAGATPDRCRTARTSVDRPGTASSGTSASSTVPSGRTDSSRAASCGASTTRLIPSTTVVLGAPAVAGISTCVRSRTTVTGTSEENTQRRVVRRDQIRGGEASIVLPGQGHDRPASADTSPRRRRPNAAHDRTTGSVCRGSVRRSAGRHRRGPVRTATSWSGSRR